MVLLFSVFGIGVYRLRVIPWKRASIPCSFSPVGGHNVQKPRKPFSGKVLWRAIWRATRWLYGGQSLALFPIFRVGRGLAMSSLQSQPRCAYECRNRHTIHRNAGFLAGFPGISRQVET